jgi:hypothetical protein
MFIRFHRSIHTPASSFGVLAWVLVLFLAVAAAHEIIPGLHIEGEEDGHAACAFCHLIHTPAIAAATICLLFLVAYTLCPVPRVAVCTAAGCHALAPARAPPA